MNEYDFKMYITEGADGLPVIVMQFAGVSDMDEAEELAEELFSIISGDDNPAVH